jgi:hypothetical protein
MTSLLEHLEWTLDASPGPLLPQVRQGLAERLGPDGEALRWSITAVASPPTSEARRLTLEAVVLRRCP